MLLRNRFVSDYGERVPGLHRARWARTLDRVISDSSSHSLSMGTSSVNAETTQWSSLEESADEGDSVAFITPPASTRSLSSLCPSAPSKKKHAKDVDMSVLSQEPDPSNWVAGGPHNMFLVDAGEYTSIGFIPSRDNLTVPVPETDRRAYIVNSRFKKCARKHCTKLRMGFGSSRFCSECRPKCEKCGVRWQVKGSFRCRTCRKIVSQSESDSE